MLQDPGQAYQGSWEVDRCAFQKLCVHESGGVPWPLWLGGVKLGSQAWENGIGCSEVFRILWRELACP